MEKLSSILNVCWTNFLCYNFYQLTWSSHWRIPGLPVLSPHRSFVLGHWRFPTIWGDRALWRWIYTSFLFGEWWNQRVQEMFLEESWRWSGFFDRFCIDTWKAKESVGIERVEGFDRVAMAWFSMGAFFFWQGLSLPEQSTHDLEHLHFPLLVAQGYTQSEWLPFKTSSRNLAGMLASQTCHLLNWYTP